MSAAYAFLLASIVLERVSDPLIAIPAVVTGLACRQWLPVACATAIIAVLAEATRYINNFQPAVMVIAWVSAAAWGSLAYAVKGRFVRRYLAVSEKAPSP